MRPHPPNPPLRNGEGEKTETLRVSQSKSRSFSFSFWSPLSASERGVGGEVCLFLFLLFLATPLHAAEITVTLGDVKAGAAIDQTHLKKLSQSVQLTLWVEGPGPLEVTTPKPLLSRGSMWRVYETGLPTREIRADGRQKWQQVYRLSPLDVRAKLPIPLAPLTVRAGNQNEASLFWDTLLEVNVESSVPNANVDSLHDPADIEQLPPPPPQPTTAFRWWLALVPVCLLLALGMILFARRKTAVVVPHDAEWAVRELTDDVTPDHCARVLREYVGYRHGIEGRSRTTTELITRLQPETRWNTEQIGALQALLDTCDQVRFSGTESHPQGLGALARAWVQRVEEAFRTPLAEHAAEVG